METLNWTKRAGFVFLSWVGLALTLHAQTFSTLESFDGADGSYPGLALVQATDGSLYGTTAYGGSNNWGTIFRITPSGNLDVLHNFGLTEGYLPNGPLMQALDGNLYGTSAAGPDANGTSGYGTVFKITPGGTLTTLYTFCSKSDCADGAYPTAGLVEGADGSLYGTTTGGGALDSCYLEGSPVGCGTVFKITPSGTLTTLYTFCAQDDCTSGATPYAGLVEGADGSFYGAASGGGSGNTALCDSTFAWDGCGTIFRITPDGILTTLYAFCSKTDCRDGADPRFALVQASDGNLYGSTLVGGANGSGDVSLDGTLFRITPTGALITLANFGASGTLIEASDGNLYGAGGRGANGNGAVFRLTSKGKLTTVYTFCNPDDDGCTAGVGVQALIQETNGRLYGTTYEGGTSDACDSGCGTVFALGIGLAPFVEMQPGEARVGKQIDILGNSLSGATGVAFNGVAATFTVQSASLIRVTVPAGATTGPVTVTTAQKTLKSNVPFRVIH